MIGRVAHTCLLLANVGWFWNPTTALQAPELEQRQLWATSLDMLAAMHT